MSEIPPVVTIFRSKWATPDKTDAPFLLDDAGLMCCLGFVCKSAGAANDDMHKASFPRQLLHDPIANDFFCGIAATINDDEDIDNEERERQLIELFDREGPCKLRFEP